jgi:hypothetical protein
MIIINKITTTAEPAAIPTITPMLIPPWEV